MSNSLHVRGLQPEQKSELQALLHDRQSGKCYICRERIDLELLIGELEIDHIEPLAVGGKDSENNFALTHARCNRSKGASDLRVARCLSLLEQLQRAAKERGDRGANLGDVLKQYNGGKEWLRLRQTDGYVEFTFPTLEDLSIRKERLYGDKLSGLQYFFSLVPI